MASDINIHLKKQFDLWFTMAVALKIFFMFFSLPHLVLKNPKLIKDH